MGPGWGERQWHSQPTAEARPGEPRGRRRRPRGLGPSEPTARKLSLHRRVRYRGMSKRPQLSRARRCGQQRALAWRGGGHGHRAADLPLRHTARDESSRAARMPEISWKYWRSNRVRSRRVPQRTGERALGSSQARSHRRVKRRPSARGAAEAGICHHRTVGMTRRWSTRRGGGRLVASSSAPHATASAAH